jgi:cell division protein FtsZ
MGEHRMVDRAVIVGVGDGGSAALNRVVDERLHAVRTVAVNTYAAALTGSRAQITLVIGEAAFGAGGDPAIGRRAAQSGADDLAAVMRGAERVIVLGGFGGGTATGALPVIAALAASEAAEALAVVTTPFTFEGVWRAQIAHKGMARLREAIAEPVVIACDDLIPLLPGKSALSLAEAYSLADRAVAWNVLARLV